MNDFFIILLEDMEIKWNDTWTGYGIPLIMDKHEPGRVINGLFKFMRRLRRCENIRKSCEDR